MEADTGGLHTRGARSWARQAGWDGTRTSARRRNHVGTMLAALMLIGVAVEEDDSGIRDLFFTL